MPAESLTNTDATRDYPTELEAALQRADEAEQQLRASKEDVDQITHKWREALRDAYEADLKIINLEGTLQTQEIYTLGKLLKIELQLSKNLRKICNDDEHHKIREAYRGLLRLAVEENGTYLNAKDEARLHKGIALFDAATSDNRTETDVDNLMTYAKYLEQHKTFKTVALILLAAAAVLATTLAVTATFGGAAVLTGSAITIGYGAASGTLALGSGASFFASGYKKAQSTAILERYTYQNNIGHVLGSTL